MTSTVTQNLQYFTTFSTNGGLCQFVPAEKKDLNPLYYILNKGLTEGSFSGMKIGRYFDYPSLIFPIQDIHGTLKNNQYIYSAGNGKFQKKFKKGGQVTGCFFKFDEDDLDKAKVIFVAEGVATAAALREILILEANLETNTASIDTTVLAALPAPNIPTVCRLLKEKYPDTQFIAAPDGDEAGSKAAKRCESLGIPSIFPPRGFDWSDIYLKSEGEALEELRASKTIVRILKSMGRRGYDNQKTNLFT